MPFSRRLTYAVYASIFAITLSASPQTPSTSDPQAVSYASSAIAALTGSTHINDVTLTGSVTWDGSDTGTASLKAVSAGESRVDLSLPSGTRTDIRDVQSGTQWGKWITPEASGNASFHNCLTDPVWFFPALGYLNGGPTTVFSYVGLESRDGISVQHIRAYLSTDPLVLIGSPALSTTDYYLDATSFLPVAITFNEHPDSNQGVNLPVEIHFSAYQVISGVSVPMHIQRYQQGNLLVDMQITGAVFNSDLPLSTFAVN